MPSEAMQEVIDGLFAQRPDAIDDVLDAWRWLRADQGVAADSIAVAGDSAGGSRSRCWWRCGTRAKNCPRRPC